MRGRRYVHRGDVRCVGLQKSRMYQTNWRTHYERASADEDDGVSKCVCVREQRASRDQRHACRGAAACFETGATENNCGRGATRRRATFRTRTDGRTKTYRTHRKPQKRGQNASKMSRTAPTAGTKHMKANERKSRRRNRRKRKRTSVWSKFGSPPEQT